MPHVEGKLLSPDEALEKGLCPECGCELSKKDPRGHALYHYPQTIDDDPHYEEARRRKALIESYKPLKKETKPAKEKPVEGEGE